LQLAVIFLTAAADSNNLRQPVFQIARGGLNRFVTPDKREGNR
jgi:hypothetical protein